MKSSFLWLFVSYSGIEYYSTKTPTSLKSQLVNEIREESPEPSIDTFSKQFIAALLSSSKLLPFEFDNNLRRKKKNPISHDNDKTRGKSVLLCICYKRDTRFHDIEKVLTKYLHCYPNLWNPNLLSHRLRS